MRVIYIVFKNALAEYEWKAPASCKSEKEAIRLFKVKFPDLEFVKVLWREYDHLSES